VRRASRRANAWRPALRAARGAGGCKPRDEGDPSDERVEAEPRIHSRPSRALIPPLGMGALETGLLVLLASFVAGFFGFGFGITATAGLSLTMPLLHAANVINLASPFVTASLFWQLRAHVVWRAVRRITPWLSLGVVAGVFALATFDGSTLVRVLGAFVVVVSLWNLSAQPLRVSESRLGDAIAGGVSGVFAGAFNSGGPALIAYVYSRPGTPEQLKATLQALFLVSTFARMAIASGQGVMTRDVLWDAALATPFAVAGQFVGNALSSRLSAERFRRTAWLGLLALGVVLGVRG
jgi:hypothetical protein